MKYRLIIYAFVLLPFATKACDICGCGAGTNYIGILPDFQKHIAGIRYRYNSIKSHVGTNGETSYLTTQENYHTIEAWLGWNISHRFRIMASVPYNLNSRESVGESRHKNGLGDITALGFYQLLNKKMSTGNSLLVQNLWAGGGVKLPTGIYAASDKLAGSDDANVFQLGTGSLDFMVSLMYDIRWQDFGMNINATQKLNTANKEAYRYGDKTSINTQLYYKIRANKKYMIAPNAGILYEHAALDNDASRIVTASGGNVVSFSTGFELSIGTISMGGNYQLPLSQSLASGIVKAGNRMMLHAAINL